MGEPKCRNDLLSELVGMVQFLSCISLIIIVYLVAMNSMNNIAIAFIIISAICALSGAVTYIRGKNTPVCNERFF